jgi:catechol 2,3-dioxygenase-like lactoylglutathione lyase family enzyme
MSESAPGDPPVATSDVRPPASQGLHHVAYACRDIEATHRFYEDLMGFELVHTEVETFESGGFFRHTFYDLGDGNCIAFFDLHGVGERDGWSSAVSKGNGLPVWVNHIAFRASAEQQQAVRERMDAAGVEPLMDVDHGWCHSLYYLDPNGIMVEMCRDTPGFTRDPEGARALFTVTEKATEQKTVTVGGRVVTP